MNLPRVFLDKMQSLLGNEYDSYLRCFDEKRYYGLRVNTAKISTSDFIKIAPWPLTSIPWVDNGFYYDGDAYQPAKHPYYYAGLYYLQEPSAMTPANRLPIEEGDKVLDVCAAPGGKATELGAKLAGTGVLVSNDISNSRAKGLLKNIELHGIGNALVLSEDPAKLTAYFTAYFDKILIDAPCSGEGMFRKEPSMVKNWEEQGPEVYAEIQKSIILQAAMMLRPGGLMLYSTCTFDSCENEEIIEYLLHECPEFEICEISGYDGFATGMPELTKNRNPDLRKTVRIFPHRMAGEGHYLALLRKRVREELCQQSVDSTECDRNNQNHEHLESDESSSGKPLVNGFAYGCKVPPEASDFFASISREMDWNRLFINNERVYYMPTQLPDVKGIRFLRTGLLLGELKKKRFEPSQALAMNLKKSEYHLTLDFPVSDERVLKYLKGETLDVEDLTANKDKGWYLVCVSGYPLGFGKLAGQTLKNKYMPGWRMM